MKKFFKWVTEHKILSCLIIILMFFIPILLVHVLFKTQAKYDFLVAEWSAGDILLYISSFYTLLGTITFSALALYQNHIINEQNEQFNQKLKEIEMQRDMPRFAVQNIVHHGNYTNLKIEIKNISDNPATNINISNFTVYDINRKAVCKSNSVNVKGTIIEAQSTIEIDFINAPLKDSNLNICFFIEFQDIFLNDHKVEVVGFVHDIKKAIDIHFRFKYDKIDDEYLLQ